MKTLAFRKLGRCTVYVSGKHPIDSREWDDYLHFLEAELTPGSRPLFLIYTESTGPTVSQRQRVNEVLLPIMKEIKAAVLLPSSPLARGIMTAMSWIHPVYKPFHHSEVDKAIDFLGVEAPEIPKIKALLEELRGEVIRA